MTLKYYFLPNNKMMSPLTDTAISFYLMSKTNPLEQILQPFHLWQGMPKACIWTKITINTWPIEKTWTLTDLIFTLCLPGAKIDQVCWSSSLSQTKCILSLQGGSQRRIIQITSHLQDKLQNLSVLQQWRKDPTMTRVLQLIIEICSRGIKILKTCCLKRKFSKSKIPF